MPETNERFSMQNKIKLIDWLYFYHESKETLERYASNLEAALTLMDDTASRFEIEEKLAGKTYKEIGKFIINKNTGKMGVCGSTIQHHIRRGFQDCFGYRNGIIKKKVLTGEFTLEQYYDYYSEESIAKRKEEKRQERLAKEQERLAEEKAQFDICVAMWEENASKYRHLPIEDLNIGRGPINALRNNDICTIGRLMEKTADEIFSTKNIGSNYLKEIKHQLYIRGLNLKGDARYVEVETELSEWKDVRALHLSKGIEKVLRREDLFIITYLIRRTEDQIKSLAGMGETKFDELKRKLAFHGLHFADKE